MEGPVDNAWLRRLDRHGCWSARVRSFFEQRSRKPLNALDRRHGCSFAALKRSGSGERVIGEHRLEKNEAGHEIPPVWIAEWKVSLRQERSLLVSGYSHDRHIG